jgi:hypothetical protein
MSRDAWKKLSTTLPPRVAREQVAVQGLAPVPIEFLVRFQRRLFAEAGRLAEENRERWRLIQAALDGLRRRDLSRFDEGDWEYLCEEAIIEMRVAAAEARNPRSP